MAQAESKQKAGSAKPKKAPSKSAAKPKPKPETAKKAETKTDAPSRPVAATAKQTAKGTAKHSTKESAKETAKATVKRAGKRYWLFKSEPFKYSLDDLKAEGPAGGEWDGIRNYQARNFMREMKVGDLAFFYHSNEGLAIVGICEVSAESHPDTTTDDDRWDCVDVRYICEVPEPVTLKAVKANPQLSEMSLVTSMRLSVQPVTEAEWNEVLKMGGLTQKVIDEARRK